MNTINFLNHGPPIAILKIENSLNDELIIRSLKILDMTYLNIVHAVVGILSAFLIDKFYNSIDMKFDSDKYDKKSIYEIFIILIIYTIVNVIYSYIIKNILEFLPFPFDGISGFKHELVPDLKRPLMFSWFFLTFQENFRKLVTYFINRLKS